MPKSTSCQLAGQQIDVDEAADLKTAALRQRGPIPDFRCIDCGQPVRPHKSGGHAAAHFEHLQRNFNCPLSHRSRGKGRHGVS